MDVRRAVRSVPGRVVTGAYILHSGLDKWSGGAEQAAGTHGMAATAFPFLRRIPPRAFLKALAAAEIGVGAALLTPLVPNRLAGGGLAAFSGSLLGMYARTPAMRRPGSLWPSRAGTAVSKDVWMFGIALGLILDGPVRRKRGKKS